MADGSNSVRSAMFIVTTTPNGRPSSVGAAWMGILARTDLRQWPSEREDMRLRTEAARSCGSL
jgi:hypothetical protein